MTLPINTYTRKLIERIAVGRKPVGSDLSGTGNSSKTFDAPVRAIDVYNDSQENMTLTAAGITRVVPPGGRECEWAEAFTEVTVTASGSWILTGYE